VVLNEQAIEKHRRAAFFAFSGPVPLPLERRLVSFTAHNVREALHALHALVRYRGDDKARQIAEACLAAIFDLWGPEKGWNLDRLQGRYGIAVTDNNENFVRTLPHAIGPLVKYYRATGYEAALDLAIVLKDKLCKDHFPEDGTYHIELQGTHGHSIACVLCSLAQLAELTRDVFLIDRVKAFYDNGMWQLRDELGWVVEKTSQSSIDRPDTGEVNSTGDLVETALILGRWGFTQYFEDAERILRCHLLPSQLRDTGFIADPPNPDGADGKRNVAGRLRGAFGFPAPYGHQPFELTGWEAVFFHLDIVGGAVGSLCEAYRDATRFDDAGHHVNLLFDYETDAIKVESFYTHGALTITLKKPGPLWVRLPSWVRPETVTIEGLTGTRRFAGFYPFVVQQPVGVP